MRQLKTYPDINDVYLTSGTKVVHIGPDDEMMEPSNHKEADTRIVVHIIDTLPLGSVLSFPFHKSKPKLVDCIRWWNTWNKHPEVTETFVKISRHPFQVLSGDDFASTTTHRLRLKSIF